MDNKYDIVIIGSGLGGLECGVMLSREGYKVCILEQSHLFGGCLQSFSRKGRNIDTGIHYIGSMDEDQIMRQYLKYFGIFDKLSVKRLDDDFDVITLGDKGEFSYNRGYDNFSNGLIDMFPNEKLGIEKYCTKVRGIGESISPAVHRSGRFTTGKIDSLSISAAAFINECVADPILRSVLAGTNVLYAGVKEASNLYHHSMINHSNIEGSYRFAEGTQRIADLLIEQIKTHGGDVFNHSKVINIEIDGADVKCVEIENGEKIYAKYFISNIHPAETFSMLGATPSIKKAYRSRLNLLPNTYGLFSVYLLMKKDSFPYINKNHYYYRNSNVWDTVLDNPDLKPKSIMLSTQLSQIGSKYSDLVTLMSPVNSTVFDQWNHTTLGNRGADYKELKETITTNIIDYTSQFCPQIKSSIEHVCAASTLTYQHYTGTPQGSAYGVLKDYKTIISTLLPTRTKLNNLFLTGQNLNVHGALGVTLTAASTCAELLGTEYLAKKIGEI